MAGAGGARTPGAGCANGVLILGHLFSLAWLLYVIFDQKPHLYQKLVPAEPPWAVWPS